MLNRYRSFGIMKELVSILTPLYNAENFLHRYLNSILSQTYEKIELILINDGSVDNSDEIVKNYKEKLKHRGIQVKYILQDNKGLGAVINEGLKLIEGKYFMWSDADDVLHEDCIEEKVKFMEQYENCNLAICKVAVVEEHNLEKVIRILERKVDTTDDFFKDLLCWKNIITVPGAYFVRTSEFMKLTGGNIFPSKWGQNFQILLPLAYQGQYAYIDNVLFTYIVRDDSMSVEFRKNDEMKRMHAIMYEEIFCKTLERMNINETEKKRYTRLVNKLFYMEKQKYIE
jgi:glycosyltransferase involved in cell wall biosynthesis